MEQLKKNVKKYNVLFWARDFLSSLQICTTKTENPLPV